MKYKVIEKQYEELKEEWKKAIDVRKTEIEDEGQKLKVLIKSNFGCYACDEVLSREQLPNVFCNEECKKAYWGANNADYKKVTKSWSVEEMIQKLKEFAEDEHKKGNY